MKNNETTRRIERNFDAAENGGTEAINAVYETEFEAAKENKEVMKDFYEVIVRKVWSTSSKSKDLFETYKALREKTREWVVENYEFCDLEDFFA